MSTTEQQSLDVVEGSAITYGCEHTDPKDLIGEGESRPASYKDVEVVPGVVVNVEYYEPDAPVRSVKIWQCPVCGAQEVEEADV